MEAQSPGGDHCCLTETSANESKTHNIRMEPTPRSVIGDALGADSFGTLGGRKRKMM